MRLGARGKAFNLLVQLKAAPVSAICDPHSLNYLFPLLPLALLPVLDHQTCTIITNVVGPIGKLANANLSLIYIQSLPPPKIVTEVDTGTFLFIVHVDIIIALAVKTYYCKKRR